MKWCFLYIISAKLGLIKGVTTVVLHPFKAHNYAQENIVSLLKGKVFSFRPSCTFTLLCQGLAYRLSGATCFNCGVFCCCFFGMDFFLFFLWLCGCMLHTHTRTHTHTCTWFLCVACRLTISGLVLVTQWSCTVPFLSVNPSTCINVICSLPSIIVWWRCLCEDCGCIKWRSLIFTFQY